MTTHRPIAEIEAELKAALVAERLAKEELRKSVKPIYHHTIAQVPIMGFDRVYDASCIMYQLTGKVLNAEEMKAAGNTPFEGSMRYLYNTLSGNIIMAVGGGSVFIEGLDGMMALSEFIHNNPAGGYVTPIVEKYRRFLLL